MRTTKWKIAAGALLAVALGGLAAGLLHPRLAAEPPVAARGAEKERARPNPAGEGKAESSDKWQDLLDTIDPDKYTVGKGIWRVKGDKLIGYPAAHGARLRIPLVPHGDYELRARWEPRTGDSSVAFIIPHGDKMASVEVMTGFGCAGLGDLNGVRPDINETRTELKVEPGKAYDIYIRVRVKDPQVHVLARLGDKTIVDWEGKRKELEHEFFAPPRPASLGLAVGGNASTFHSLQLRMLTGKAVPWRAASTGGGR
jgi:hypothetical protein